MGERKTTMLKTLNSLLISHKHRELEIVLPTIIDLYIWKMICLNEQANKSS